MPSLSAAFYQGRCQTVGTQRKGLARRSRRVANVRLGLFLAVVAFLVAGQLNVGAGVVRWVAIGLLSVAYGVLVVVHVRLKRRIRYADALWASNDEAAKRVRRAWAELPVAGEWTAPEDHAYAGDLDVAGEASIFQLLGSVKSLPGREVLFAWLIQPSPAGEVRRRQQAVAELAPRLSFRQRLEVTARVAGHTPRASLEQFFRWAEDTPWLADRRRLVWLARLTGVVTLPLMLLQLFGVVPLALWLLPVMVNFAVTAAVRRPIHGIFARAVANEASFRAYVEMLEAVGDASFESGWLTERRTVLTRADAAAPRELQRLYRILALIDNRFSQLYPVLQGLLLVDVHLLDWLERWQRRSGQRAREWLTTIGEIEAVCGLAGLSHDNPDWVIPDVHETERPVLTARQLGHPLLPTGQRVDNDIDLGPPGTFLLVTGSNMSGKSTLLRAIGANTVLGLAGGPVCATSMSLPAVRLYTSMRIHDSLETGVSYFMAGLRRLKTVVDAARNWLDPTGAPAPAAAPVLYLLDEILQGTNTAERQIAVRGVIGELLVCHALGAVTTHDLTLAEAPELAEAQRAVHFTESFDAQGGMTFDYTLRPGVATSRNALRLMEMMGLPTRPGHRSAPSGAPRDHPPG